MDYKFFQIINNLAGRWNGLDLIGIFCAKYLLWAMMIAVLGFLVIYKDKAEQKTHLKVTVKTFFAAFLGYFLKIAIQFFYVRPRPFVSHEVMQLIDKSADPSFPSGHTVLAFAIAFSIWFYNKKLGSIFLLLALLVGLGRIYVGVHYPLDVLGGVLVGALSAFVVKGYLSSISYSCIWHKKKK